MFIGVGRMEELGGNYWIAGWIEENKLLGTATLSEPSVRKVAPDGD
jgi:hypothetical protein